MRKTNYHMHTRRCMHASGRDEEYVISAIKNGYEEIGFSDHSPWNYDSDFVANMDLYRMVRQKSFYISMTVMLLLYLWLTTAVGLQNNTPFATFHQGKDTLVDFLYYFPKSSFYQIAVLIFLSLFFCEEYASGFVKNIYPMMHRKELLLLERFVFSFITAFIYWAVIIVMVVVENLWQQDSFASFSILQFICYSLMQMLILTVIASFLNMLIHATGSKVLAILVSVGYGSMTVFMLHAGIMSLLKVEYTDYILYAISGQLPYSWDAVFYSRAAMVAITSAILYNIGSYVLLRKKDLK